MYVCFFFSSRRRHTRCALVTGVQTCALPILDRKAYDKTRSKVMKSIKTVGVVGAGAMGRGIAQIAAQAGLDVLLFDLNAQAIEAARENLQQMWGKQIGRASCRERVCQYV